MRSILIFILALLTVAHATHSWANTLTIRVIDESTKALTPARIELLDSEGQAVIADDALPISNDCALAPLPSWLAQPPPKTLANPFTNSEHHYINGIGHYQLNPGRYTLRVFKGPEYIIETQQVTVGQQAQEINVALKRWYHAKQQGWYSTDVHLHLTRQSDSANNNLSLWMAAEDLNVANLLQMGALTHFAAAPQYGFGGEGTFANGHTLLVSGQEHPRTHIFGHSLSLGAQTSVDERNKYIQYNATFEQVKSAGGINGFAHWGAGPSKDGLAINAPQGNVELLEVLGFGSLYVDTWYELLNLGFQIAAVAGTDFPCLPGVPGRERTYFKSLEPPSRQGMVEALRQGLAMGADKAVLIKSEQANSQVLAEKIKELGCDLILGGKKTIDSESSWLEAGVAATLDMPFVHCANKLEWNGDAIAASRELSGALQSFKVSLPAVFAQSPSETSNDRWFERSDHA